MYKKNFIIKYFNPKNIDSGIIIFSKKKSQLFKINKNEITRLFNKHGFIIFKGFDVSPEKFLKFSKKFTTIYANDAARRTSFFSNKIKNVDEGKCEMPLHSEASYSPSWPEIVWFYCSIPPKKSGWTTICDGEKVYKKMTTQTKKFFLANPINYFMSIPFEKTNNKMKKKKLKEWFLDYPGVDDCYLDTNNKKINLKLSRYAVVKTKKENLSFSNHLQIFLDRDPQLLKWIINKKKKLPRKIYLEIKKICKNETQNIKWKKNDFCMIDNHRYMHGRRKILSSDENRKIYNIQTLKSNF